MRALIISVSVTAVLAFGGAVLWQARAAAPAFPVPQAMPLTEFTACSGPNVDCPRGRWRKCTPQGGCWCAPC